MSRIFGKKRLLAGFSVVAVLVCAAAAFAYFTSTGSGTGNATVGSSTAFAITSTAPTGGPLYPGSGLETVGYTVTNPSAGAENLAATTAALTADTAGGVFDTGTNAYVDGCKASWFTVTNTTKSGDISGGASLSSSATIALTDTTTTDQDACQGLSPQLTITAS